MIRVNLLGLPKQKKRAAMVTLQGGRSLALLAGILVLVAVIQFFRYEHLEDQDKQLTKLVHDRQTEKIRLEAVRGQYEKLSQQKALLAKRTDIIEGLKAKQSGPSRMLDTLANVVAGTDTLWLTNYELTGQKVTIEGFAFSAKAVADFLTQLKTSKALTDMDLKETFQDSTVKELRKFVFTVNGQLPNPSPTS